jgi:hypothetical protein
MTPKTRAVYDALNEVEAALGALEGVELLALAGNDGAGDLHVVKIDQFVALMYLVRTTLEARVEALRDSLKALYKAGVV